MNVTQKISDAKTTLCKERSPADDIPVSRISACAYTACMHKTRLPVAGFCLSYWFAGSLGRDKTHVNAQLHINIKNIFFKTEDKTVFKYNYVFF